ncbi:MAG: hypothetical protein COX07_00645 [Bacteroidetes bacterium CG23_combo_of_CG06-09_8_20_14_all_32_9]|nr:MAG: hypothetical protein COX07_00645 [Bacteroidetes bacterium CG23_combo_of_CG06-09_8_20_14_all_32_9]
MKKKFFHKKDNDKIDYFLLQMNENELKQGTRQFAHCCVKLALVLHLLNEATELTSIFIVSHNTDQINK